MNIKRWFDTPRKALISTLCIVVAVAVIILLIAFAVRGNDRNEMIGKTTAEAVALKDAGYDSSQVRMERTELDREKGTQVYDVSFVADGKEYEYWVDAYDSTIVSRQIEPDDGVPGTSNNVNNLSPSPSQTAGNGTTSPLPTSSAGNYIGVEKAKSIALSHAGLTSAEVTYTEAKLDQDNGRMEYEIDFYKDDTEYEYSIDAITGKILSHESGIRD